MKAPLKTALTRVDLVRVGADGLIADFGDYLEVKNGVVIAVHHPEEQENKKIDLNTLVSPKLITQEKKKKEKRRIRIGDFRDITYDLVLDNVRASKKGTSVTQITKELSDFLGKEIPLYVVRARIETLNKEGKLDRYQDKDAAGRPWVYKVKE